MNHHSSYRGLNQKRGSRGGGASHVMTWVVVVIFIALFCFAVFWFRTSNKNPGARADAASNVSASSSVDSSAPTADANLERPNAQIIGLSSGKQVGAATREILANAFHLTMKATLPNIDQDKQFYAAWLVRQVPYDYVAAGSFSTNTLGAFVLDWNGDTRVGSDVNLQAYTHVVITLQTKDGDADPQGHVAEGDFKAHE